MAHRVGLAPFSWPPAVYRSHGLPFRYTIHWGTPGTPAQVEIHADPNPMPRFRLWRWPTFVRPIRGGRRFEAFSSAWASPSRPSVAPGRGDAPVTGGAS